MAAAPKKDDLKSKFEAAATAAKQIKKNPHSCSTKAMPRHEDRRRTLLFHGAATAGAEIAGWSGVQRVGAHLQRS